MYEDITKKVLEMFREKLVIRKSELVELIKDDVSKNPGNPTEVVDAILKMFIQKKMITPVYASQTTFAITQRGIR